MDGARRIATRAAAAGRALAVRLAALVALSAAGAAEAEFAVTGLSLTAEGEGARLEIALSAPARYRVFTLDAPRRLVVDLPEADWAFDAPPPPAGPVSGLRYGLVAPGTSRLVVDLARPVAAAGARLADTASGAVLTLSLAPTPPERFAAAAGWPEGALRPADAGRRKLRVVVDPGHGGIDPGAMRADLVEKDIVLEFSLLLRDRLEADDCCEVVMTREADVYVPLRERVAIARRADGDVMLSIHADAARRELPSGASVYLLSDEASDAEAEALAERENRADAFLDPSMVGETDGLARALIDLVRTETMDGSRALGEALVAELDAAVGVLDVKPLRAAGFRVLKAPDVPSALIEIGFLTNPDDRERLVDGEWRADAADAIVAAVRRWSAERRDRGTAPRGDGGG